MSLFFFFGVIDPKILMPPPLDFLVDCCWYFPELSAQERLVVEKVDTYWHSFTPLFPCCTHVIQTLSFPHLEVCACDEMKCGKALESSLDLPAAAVLGHPHTKHLDHPTMGGGNPPTSLADSILSTISVSLVLLLSN